MAGARGAVHRYDVGHLVDVLTVVGERRLRRVRPVMARLVVANGRSLGDATDTQELPGSHCTIVRGIEKMSEYLKCAVSMLSSPLDIDVIQKYLEKVRCQRGEQRPHALFYIYSKYASQHLPKGL